MSGQEDAIKTPLADQYMGTWLGVDVAALVPGEVVVVESARRLRPERSYGFVHAMWALALPDGRMAASVPPGAGPGVRDVLRGCSPECLFAPELADEARPEVDRALAAHGVPPVNRVFTDLRYACTAATLRRHHDGDVRRLTDGSIPAAEGLALPAHCFPDGIVYGVVEDARVVAVAYAHRSGNLEGRVADPGVETAPAYRRRGFARTCVSAVAAHVIDRGGEALYHCSPGNRASQATARSVGYFAYGRSLILGAPYVFAD